MNLISKSKISLFPNYQTDFFKYEKFVIKPLPIGISPTIALCYCHINFFSNLNPRESIGDLNIHKISHRVSCFSMYERVFTRIYFVLSM